MSKLIALKSGSHEILPDAWHNDFSNLKQQVLLFDQIGIFRLNSFYKALTESIDLLKKFNLNTITKPESIVAELQWLQQEGVIFEPTIHEEFNEESLIKTRLNPNFETAKELLKKILAVKPYNPQVENKIEPSRLKSLQEQQFTLIRLMAIVMEASKGVTAVTTAPYTEYTRELQNSSKSDVAQVVIKKLPLPSNETPWEQLIDYRNDAKTQRLLLSLRRWINKISTQNLSSLEIEDEIEFLINEFQEHMKLHKMKANTETMEVITNSVSDVLGNLLTLKFSKFLEPLFAIKKQQLSLLEAELNAPGKELAYIIKSRETFNSQE